MKPTSPPLVAGLAAFSAMLGVSARPLSARTRALSAWAMAEKDWMGMLTPFAPMDKDARGEAAAGVSYTSFTGDGSVAQGWPDQGDWKSWEELWASNKAAHIDHTPNSAQETSWLHDAILTTAHHTHVDARFILATIIQESRGDVRVPTTALDNPNPGLMQSYGAPGFATATCSPVPTTAACPRATIEQMVREGTASNGAGMGLEDLLARGGGGGGDDDDDDVAKYYRATRMYNSGPGSIPASGDLSERDGAATWRYAGDVANRLLGWVGS